MMRVCKLLITSIQIMASSQIFVQTEIEMAIAFQMETEVTEE